MRMFRAAFRTGGTLGLWIFGGVLLFSSIGEAQTASLAIVAQTAPAQPGEIATATVTVDGSADVSGFSFGVEHDPAALTLAAGGVTMGSDLAATRGGAGPEFLSIDLFSNGFTFATVINVNLSGTDLAAAVTHTVTSISYTVSTTAAFGSTALTFSEALGTPPVALSVGMGLQFVEPPTTVDAALFTSPPYIRGDVNENGQVTVSDAIALLSQLFNGLPMDCADASDVNESGMVTVADALALLAYLFNEGTPPGAPAGLCGLPATPSSLGCQSFNCP